MGVKLSSVRRGWLLAIVGVCAMGMSAPRMQAKAAGAASVSVQPEQTAPLASSGDEKGQQPTGQYRLSQERYEKAVAFSRAEYRLHFVSAAWGIAALLLVLRLGVVARLRDFAEAWGGGSRWLQAAIFVSALLGVLAVLHLPLRVYGHTLVVRYELSVQGWGSWLWDWTKGELLTIGLAIVVGRLLLAVIRWKPRTWWLYFWMAAVPLALFLFFISPWFVDPLFDKFMPLQEKHPELVVSIEKADAARGRADSSGADVPDGSEREDECAERVCDGHGGVEARGDLGYDDCEDEAGRVAGDRGARVGALRSGTRGEGVRLFFWRGCFWDCT
jgi:hypothetical protein